MGMRALVGMVKGVFPTDKRLHTLISLGTFFEGGANT